MCLQGEADANKVSEQVTLGYTQATTATTGGQLSARSGSWRQCIGCHVVAICRWQLAADWFVAPVDSLLPQID